jgi:hypothetical protein
MNALTLGPYRFTQTDVIRTFAALGAWWKHLTDGIAAPHWTTAGSAWLQSLERHTGTPAVGDAAQASTRHDPSAAFAEIGKRLADRFADRPLCEESQAALSTVWHGVLDLTASLRSRDAVPTNGTGTVQHVNVSAGGVPKRHIARAEVDFRGLRGDKQGARTHHGRPWQALCLWSGEVIDSFAAAGHPIAPGSAGENLTLRGIDWHTMRPGMRMRIGTALIETSAWAIPCRKNSAWFADGDHQRLSHERGPVSRIYATVIEPGAIAVGDTLSIQH